MAQVAPVTKISEMRGQEEEAQAMAKPLRTRISVFLKKQLLLILLLLSIIIGVGLGAGLRSAISPNDVRTLSYLNFPGEILMRALKMLILPLLTSTLIAALSDLDAKASGSMGFRAVLYYLTTTFIAVILGIVLVLIIRPGANRDVDSPTATSFRESRSDTADAFLDLLRNMFPDNLAVATFKSSRTILEEVKDADGNVIVKNNVTVTKPVLTHPEGTNVLGVVTFSLLLGLIIARMGPVGRPLADFFNALAEASMRMVQLVIWYSPFGIVFLIASEIVRMDDPASSLAQLGLYIATILTGLTIHGFIILPLIYVIVCRKNPFTFLLGISQAMATALGTASSSATLPMTYRCLEENNGLDTRVTRFVLPVGATINMDGTALYEAVAPIFIAQLNNISLSIGQVIAISITATCASIGAASVPQAGLVTMVIVLTAVGLPTNDIAKIIAVDWFLDRFRTMVNVLGDSIGAGVVAHLSRKELQKAIESEELTLGQEIRARRNSQSYDAIETVSPM